MIRIADTAIKPEVELEAFRARTENAGAIASFTGLVRDDGQTQTLTLSHYPGFTEGHIASFVQDANTRWSLLNIQIVHRIGRMKVGDPIVFVATAASHRREAFEACDYLMDRLKCDAPFWKQETINGADRWIEPRAKDRTDLSRWSI